MLFNAKGNAMNLKLRQITSRFHSFGGMRLVREYVRMGLLPKILKSTVKAVVHGKSLETVVNAAYADVDRFLYTKYRPVMLRLKERYKDEQMGVSSPKVWSCWLQGLGNAPEIVKVCLASKKEYIKDKEHVFISLANYKEYISLPAFIEEKYRKGRIPPALFSDLIRLELLIRYGGTWMDATILCTGDNYPKEFLNSDLFLYRYLRADRKTFAGISNWFISARSNHKVLLILRDMLYQYWQDYDCLIEYYVFHRFFCMIVREYPEVLADMPEGYNPAPILLAKRQNDEYDAEWMRKLAQDTCFHKTTYRVKEQAKLNPNSFYSRICSRSLMEGV